MVAAGPNGELYFVDLEGDAMASLHRSSDGGRTWSHAFPVAQMDRENVAVDTSNSRFRGRIYVGGGVGLRVLLYHSADGGRRFIKSAEPRLHCQIAWLTVTTDGSLIVPCSVLEPPFEFGVFVSKDGGRTLSPFHHISRFPERGTMASMNAITNSAKILVPDEGWINECTVDASNRYRNRIYCVWAEEADKRNFVARLLIAKSDDDGTTWTSPKVIDVSRPLWATQIMPALAVSRDGVLGISWVDTRQSRTRDRSDEYFSASFDGGKTFAPAIRVSSASSFPAGAGNLQLAAALSMNVAAVKPSDRAQYGAGDQTNVISSAYTSRPGGGDYFAMTADALGSFHLVWSDARTGTWQTYTARITIALAGAPAFVRPRNLTCGSLANKALLDIESPSVDPRTRLMTLWTRIHNISHVNLYGPFSADVVRVTPGGMRDTTAPIILNASNGKPGAGARFDFARAAGPLEMLGPGDVTQVRVWQLRATSLRGIGGSLGTTIQGCSAGG